MNQRHFNLDSLLRIADPLIKSLDFSSQSILNDPSWGGEEPILWLRASLSYLHGSASLEYHPAFDADFSVIHMHIAQYCGALKACTQRHGIPRDWFSVNPEPGFFWRLYREGVFR